MLYKWKFILTNWINCYFDSKKKECITIDTLLTVISHLHKNLSLDESTSSILEAQNIEEFILEKYPEFKFKNGTVEPTNDEELYIVASLLLFFVCVNSKEVDIKQAMCSKLNWEDQETILKFSKCLMDCSPVTYRDVEAAITEACGQESLATGGETGVAATPPALRALHGEVRRLQAALDAETFDRTYLQEELTRTNLRMEKLLKDKEQHKLEIMNLKAKISLCCGQEAEGRDSNTESETSSRLTRQLQELEERLVATQEQLDDALYERDVFKAKIKELKEERDKWLSMSQQESSRALQLADELDVERRRVQSLQELVSELRQHHRNNVLDGSQLECDDPDSSAQSLHNVSVCSEACANVIEVQLQEERSKIVVLKQQIQHLQDQFNDLTLKSENERLSLEEAISVKENDIVNLKHRINEETNDKIKMKEHYAVIVDKLNYDITELEQKLKDNTEASRTTIDQKMQEIQTLQEEKLLLLQSFSDETTKLESIIKNLKTDIDTEKNLKVKMKEDYEIQFMKLKEKVLNRNNELVELQNKVFEKGEMIEEINRTLKKEKELNSDLSNKFNHEISRLNDERNDIEHNLYRKSEEAKELQKRLSQNVAIFAEMNREIDDMKAANTEMYNYNLKLEEEKGSLLAEIKQRDIDVDGIRKEIENITNIFSEEKNKYVRNVEERNATINALQVRLRDEIQYKTELENELQNLHQAKGILCEEIAKLDKEISVFKTELQEKERIIYALDLYLKEEKHANKTLKTENEKLNEELTKLTEELSAKNSEVNILAEQLHASTLSFEEELRKKEEVIERVNKQLISKVQEKEDLQTTLEAVTEEKISLNNALIERCNELANLQQDYEKLRQVFDENVAVIESLGNKIERETKKYLQLELEFDTQTSNLMAKLNKTEKTIKEISSKSRNTLEDKELQIQTLKLEVDDLNTTIENDRENKITLVREIEALTQKVDDEISYKNKIETEYQSQCAIIDKLTAQFTSEINLKSDEINTLRYEIESFTKLANDKSKELKIWQAKTIQEQDAAKKLMYKKNQEIEELKSKIEDFKQELKNEIASKTQAFDALQRENEQLHFTIEEDNSNHEIITKEKDVTIQRLEEHLNVVSVQLESIRKEHENAILMWEKLKIELREELAAKDEVVAKLHEQMKNLKTELEQSKHNAEKSIEDFKRRIDKIVNESNAKESEAKAEISELTEKIAQYKAQVIDLELNVKDLNIKLMNDVAVKDALKKEREHFMKENERLLEELCREQSASKELLVQKDTLIEEKIIMAQEIVEEKSVRDLVEQEKRSLLAEKEIIQQQLIEETSTKNILQEENLCLAQQLVKEKSNKELLIQEKLDIQDVKDSLERKFGELEQEQQSLEELKVSLELKLEEELRLRINLEQERDYLLQEKNEYVEKKNQLDEQLAQENIAKSLLNYEVNRLNELLLEESAIKDELYSEKTSLCSENDSLKRDILELNTIQDVLRHDKELIGVEKEKLVHSLSEEKAVRDELESEKNAVSVSLQGLNERYASEMREKEDQLTSVSTELKQVKTDFKKHEDISVHIASVLNSGLVKLLNNIKKDEIENEVLQKLVSVGNEDDLPVNEKCDLLINIADTLSTEFSLRRNLEKALEHESSAVNEMKEMIKEKEMQVLELQTEVKCLQQVVYENQVELSKQTETYNTTLDSKVKDIQALKHENKSMNNELNDVKVQLDVKVHSLKEKLIDNENLTDKLKKTYECQIDNLNVMITKLTSYLKEKTAELEALRKEKDKLQLVIDENNKVIKSLEEEVKVQKVNQEKLIGDFESERQVIKNMVTVTESIMDDQKISLNKVIADHEKTIEILLEEKKSLEKSFESDSRKTGELLLDKQTAFDLVFNELAELRKDKEVIEIEFQSQKELLNNEIAMLKEELSAKNSSLELLEVQNQVLKKEKVDIEKINECENKKQGKEIESLKGEIQEKVSNIESLESRIDDLTVVINNLKDDLLCLKEKDNELKIKKDSLESELLVRIDKLTKVLTDDTSKNDKFKFSLQEKLQTKTTVVEKVKILTDEIIGLVKEKNEYISKLDEVKAESESNDIIAKKKIEELKAENRGLITAIEENKTVIANLDQLIKDEFEKNQKLRNNYMTEKLNLENRCSQLQEYLSKAEKVLHERESEISSLKEHQKKAEITLRDKDSEIVSLKENQVKTKMALHERDSEISSLKEHQAYAEKTLQERDTVIISLKEHQTNGEKALQEKDRVISSLKEHQTNTEKILQERDRVISSLKEHQTNTEKIMQEKVSEINLLKEHQTRIEKIMQDRDTEILSLTELQTNTEKIIQEKESGISSLKELETEVKRTLEEKDREISSLNDQLNTLAKLKDTIEDLKEELANKDMAIAKIAGDKDEVIMTLSEELISEKAANEKYQRELETKSATVYELRQKLEEVKSEAQALEALKKENGEMIRVIGERETSSHEKLSSQKYCGLTEKELRDRHQVSTPTSDLTHSSLESLKTITDLEKIIHDKNRTITTLQSDITYMKTLMADSENKLLDVTKELEMSKENCDQLSTQLKKIVQQKNEEIADFKKQVAKMSVTENRASQIIKVSAKYQAIILKRIAEIKSNTILKELTNFGNSASCDGELKRNLNSGAITLEDLENFLETTDKHLKRCTEKQIALQKERDRLAEVNRINESEIINMKKFLTELSVAFRTFSSIKELYTQKLSRVVSVQRTVRREILNLEGHVTDAMMCRLERGYAAVMQDLSECAMNLERWVERCVARTISTEKIKQAFLSDTDRLSLASTSFQNTSLEVQLEELDKSFQKLLEEVARATKGEGAKDPQSVTVMEVRAEYEDKLNRMKAKMKQLYQEQIQVFKTKQKEEIATLERELLKTRESLSETSRAYEEHIKSLTTELWSVGEKFLMKKDEAEWLRKKQRSGSLMSLQHVHSAGLVPRFEELPSRPSDTCSLRSLPVHNENKREKQEGRGFHMSDEEGEVFDNRWLKELATPRRESIAVGRRDGTERISELQFRNSLCPPHLKSSYPAETQFSHALDEDEIKCTGGAAGGGRGPRKEVGITAYKKPGPPTPSKQAGRLSNTDSELRESLRVEAEPGPSRKTSTPSRLRSLFRSGRSDVDGTPRRRLSNIFRKK